MIELFVVCFYLYFIATLLLLIYAHIGFAVFIRSNALVLQRRNALFGEPGIWFCIVLALGLLGIVTYWVIHHSRLARGLDQTTDQN